MRQEQRALAIDDFGDTFNSKPRTDPFETVDVFQNGINGFRSHRYFYHVKDTRFTAETQTGFINIVHDGSEVALNQYSMDTQGYLGSFEFKFDGGFGELDFYPTKFELNNYVFDFISLDINNLSELNGDIGIGSTTIGDLAVVSGFTTLTTAAQQQPFLVLPLPLWVARLPLSCHILLMVFLLINTLNSISLLLVQLQQIQDMLSSQFSRQALD